MTNSNTKPHTDIKRLVWIERKLPSALRPYAYLIRIDRPIGIWLLLIPGLWGITLASLHFPSLYICTLFMIGAVLMRGAGCIINDVWDRELDKQVERTQNRPLASNTISVRQALIFLATLLLISFFILIQFNSVTIILGFATLPLIAIYPLMKRYTYWPQIVLGITFNMSALMGYSAVSGEVSAGAMLLYLGAILWTVGYDTIYAHQDKEDDALIGVKSTALKFGEKSKLYVSLFYCGALLCIFLSHPLGISSVLILLPALHAAWNIKTWDTDNQESSLYVFKSNTTTGLLVLLFLLI